MIPTTLKTELKSRFKKTGRKIFPFLLLLNAMIFTGILQADSTDTRGNIIQNPVMIDTSKNIQIDTQGNQAEQTSTDTSLQIPAGNKTLTNTKLFIYIVITAGGMFLFFYIFVLSLFKTFHRTRSTRQAMMLSWSSFFVISIIWIFIVWGLLSGFWTSSSFVVVMIFLFILSLITALIALKSK